MHEKLFGGSGGDIGTLDSLQKYLPLPYPPSFYSGLMGHLPFLMPNASGAAASPLGALFPSEGAQLAAMRQLHAHLGHNHRLLVDSLHDQDTSFSNGGSSLIKSPKVHRFSPYSVPSVTGGESAFYRMSNSQSSMPTLGVGSEADNPPSPKESTAKV